MTTEKRILLTKLDEIEIHERELLLDAIIVRLDEKRAEVKTKLAAMKAELRELEHEADALKQSIQSGQALKEVDCDVVEVTAKSVTRKDTGAFIEYLPLVAKKTK